MKKIVLSCFIVVVIIAVAGGIFITRHRTLTDVLQLSEDDVYIARVITSSKTDAVINKYWTNDDTEIHTLFDLLASTEVSFSGWTKESGVSYPGVPTLYEITVSNGNDTAGWAIFVTSNGNVYYGDRKYSITADQAEPFLAQLAEFCSTWELTNTST